MYRVKDWKRGNKSHWHILRKSGEQNINAKITNDDAARIREMYATKNYTQTELAAMFGLTQGNISQIITGKSYKVKPNETNPEEIR